MKISNERDVWLVITNSDLTEGRGSRIILHYCFSESTARRLAKGEGVQGSNATVEKEAAYKIKDVWYSRVYPKYATNEDTIEDTKRMKIAEAKQKAAAAGLTKEEIELLQS